MMRQGLPYGVFFNLILTCTSAIQTLKDITDLQSATIPIKSFPRHGLILLHWFANNVAINSSGDMQLTFDVGQGSFGLHCYKDSAKDAPFESSQSHYYSLGDLECRTARMFPFYVTHDFHNSVDSSPKNLDRILIQVPKNNPRNIEKVFIVEYKGQGCKYDQEYAYEISTRLLTQIKALGSDIGCDPNDPRLNFSLCEFLNYQQKAAKVLMVYPETRGLEWFLPLAGYDIDSRFNDFSQASFCALQINGEAIDICSSPSYQISDVIPNKAKLEVKSTSGGYAKITWSGIPEDVARMKLDIGIYRSRTDTDPLEFYPLDRMTHGSKETSVPLNPGLQVRLLQSETVSSYIFFGTTYYTTVWKGPEFHEANKVPPVNIRGYQSSLQLYTEDGYACARLYIHKSFGNWKNVFDKAWVGFYTSDAADNAHYKANEWCTNFQKSSQNDCPLDYEIYQYNSGLSIGPGVQARFLLTKHYASEKARTAPWTE